eukprot:scaffold51_cov125-Skeletonema_dohrnii-CCMP3373.AAC.1
MNPSAGEWKPSVAASEWTPSGTAAPAAAPAPPPKTESAVSDIDESDPLWQVVLTKICNGDRDRALKLINDPDQLTQYPEVEAILAAGDAMEEDWEKEGDKLAKEVDGMAIDDSKPAAADTKMEEEEPEEVVDAVEGDPREHLNLVFIGHVDAGKSTLSGNILYLTENVDKRTIEKYEAEAKERNRESWFLAFIMDTNEEERAK